MAMSKQHKEALAKGRRESKAIKSYLEALGSRRPGRPVTTQSLKTRITTLDSKIASETDVLRRVDLLQDRLDAESALAAAENTVDLAKLEAGFVRVVRDYSERKEIGYSAWRAAGVPAAVLKKAGIARARRS